MRRRRASRQCHARGRSPFLAPRTGTRRSAAATHTRAQRTQRNIPRTTRRFFGDESGVSHTRHAGGSTAVEPAPRSPLRVLQRPREPPCDAHNRHTARARTNSIPRRAREGGGAAAARSHQQPHCAGHSAPLRPPPSLPTQTATLNSVKHRRTLCNAGSDDTGSARRVCLSAHRPVTHPWRRLDCVCPVPSRAHRQLSSDGWVDVFADCRRIASQVVVRRCGSGRRG